MTTEFVPNAAQALTLKTLAEDGSEFFGEKLHTYLHLHAAEAETGQACCPCLACDPKSERRLTG